MNKRDVETKVIINVLLGKVKIVSRNRHLQQFLDNWWSKRIGYKNIKRSIALFNLRERTGNDQYPSTSLEKKVIECKITALLRRFN